MTDSVSRPAISRVPQPHRRVLAALNVQGGDGLPYVMMMRADGSVIARRVPPARGFIRIHKFVADDFRTEETLRYLAEKKKWRIS